MHPIRLSALVACWLSIPASAITFENVEQTFDTLQTWYNSSTGLWNTGWWNSANCLNMLANWAAIDDSIKDRTKDLVQEAFIKAPIFNAHDLRRRRELPSKLYLRDNDLKDAANSGFLNGFYDDEGWWALAWIAVFDLTGDHTYLNEAVAIFEDVHAAFNTTPVGGIWWDKDKTYVNAIANELHFSVAAHLANRCSFECKQDYTKIARDSWEWLYGSGMINDHNSFKDGTFAPDPTGLNLPIVWSCE